MKLLKDILLPSFKTRLIALVLHRLSILVLISLPFKAASVLDERSRSESNGTLPNLRGSQTIRRVSRSELQESGREAGCQKGSLTLS